MQDWIIYLDKIFLPFYHILSDPVLAYFLGTFILAVMCIFLGELLVGIAFYANRHYVKKLTNDLVSWSNLSVEAVKKGDTEAYHTFNKEANDVYGKLFFLTIAHSAAFLIPIPFVLSWMQFRFGNVEFPLPFYVPYIGDSVSYIFTFIVLYLPAYWLFKRIKNKLPVYRYFNQIMQESSEAVKEMKSLADLLEERIKASKAKHKNIAKSKA
ncbi:hypothetical protein [Thermodesulfatator autotrophicus]|uniref:DUF106 domain-containing protein n=1 Tax=Thermodesulfatator autotrophicus TaxID=1795632 RepID=A0A177E707_9BACT|nr:hypothetical protein [Thermodesulfatator autotrophicus]OAG27724.1 hypothetical protein TH606_05455 [Thermodesulfatator autotrophicus]